ncbi:MAG: serine/threonine-protein kinase [Pseudonocardia sp.]
MTGEGDRFGGYRLGPLLGRGGMGEVYRATDEVRGRTVALKLLRADLAGDPEFAARFRREAAVASRLRDPHVIPIHDHGEIEGRLFIDMRLVEGTDLGQLIRSDGPLDAGRAVGIITQVAAALDAAHVDGLVHRDVKPSNVLVTSRPGRPDFAYLVDFGIARDLADDGLSRTGVAVGTLRYMAPEQFLAAPLDRRADVYSLACVLFEALTGTAPFVADGLPSLMYAHLNTPSPRLVELRAELPRRLDAVLARGLAKRPEERFPGAGVFAEAATAAVQGTEPDAPTAVRRPTRRLQTPGSAPTASAGAGPAAPTAAPGPESHSAAPGPGPVAYSVPVNPGPAAYSAPPVPPLHPAPPGPRSAGPPGRRSAWDDRWVVFAVTVLVGFVVLVISVMVI